MIYIGTVSNFLDNISNTLTSITSKYLSSPFVSALIAFVLFAFGCWAISYFSKK